ncbi:hypothetical protein, partial [Ligilactobacillus agilis]|uniref:hypothetical protein n=1 Tax=Ligilactobacillus agilis TaxID=1601 RepID=UPI001CDC953B
LTIRYRNDNYYMISIIIFNVKHYLLKNNFLIATTSIFYLKAELIVKNYFYSKLIISNQQQKI